MLAKRIIPCLDVRKGSVTKGIRFEKNIDIGDPVEMARYYCEQGADELVFYDIGASPEDKGILLGWVEKVAGVMNIPFTVGGGIRTISDMRAVLLAGAEKISLNTAAVLNPELIRRGAEAFGSQCIVVGIDARKSAKCKMQNAKHSAFLSGYEIYIKGGREATGIDAVEWVKKVEELGAGEVCVNSIDADGTKSGYEVELTRMVVEAVSIPVIASGGAGSLEHVQQVFEQTDCAAALLASVVHYGEVSIGEIKRYLARGDVLVRI